MSLRETACHLFSPERAKDHCARPRPGLTIALLLILFCPMIKAQTPPVPDTTKQDLSVIAPSQGQPDTQTLAAESSLEGEVGGGRTRRYLLNLEAGQFARIVVEYSEIDISLRAATSDGTLLAVADDDEDKTGNMGVNVLAEVAGAYRVEIQSVDEEAEAGHYIIRVAELHVATPLDRQLIEADKVLLDGHRLLSKKTAESRRQAIEKYKQAALLFRLIGDRASEATIVNNIGMVYGWMGDNQSAQDYFNQALALQQENNNGAGEARALKDIGNLLGSVGEWQKALDYHQRALALRRSAGSHRGIMNSLDNIGLVYAKLGEPQKALLYYNRAVAILRETGPSRIEAKLLSDIGQAYEVTGEKQKALEHYERALALQRERNNRGGAAVTLHRAGLVYASSGQLQKALERYAEALKIQQTLGNAYKAADTLTSIGEVYYRLGDAPKALDYLSQSSALRVGIAASSDEALTRYWVAHVRHDQGDLTGALKEIEAAVGIVENLRSKIVSTDLRASYFATVEQYYDFYIELLMQLHGRNPSSGYEETALTVSERARARSLLELLREARADIRRGVDPALLERERSLQHQLNAKAEEQSGLRINKRTETRAGRLAEELETLTTEFLELEAQIRQKSPRYAALTQPRPLNLKEIQKLLDPQTLLLEYKLGETSSYLWAVTPSSIKSFELPKRSEVEAAARHLYELLTERNRQANGETPEQRQMRLKRAELEYGVAAARLSQMLLEPAASLLENKRLLIVGDGALNYIPLAALPDPANVESEVEGLQLKVADRTGSRLQTPDSRPPLIVAHEIISLPSASVLAALRQDIAGRRSSPRLIAVLADPVFDGADARVRDSVKASASRRHAVAIQTANTSALQDDSVTQSGLDTGVIGASNSIPRLPFSRREAAMILASAPAGQSKAALDFGANRATATGGELSQYRYIHFATHGLLNSSHPELSGIVLSLVDEQGRRQDGFLRLHEIYNLELPADLIVLSACQTGLGKEIKGEGLVGLTRGFMYAGAARVTASLWKVDDAATAELMGRFYFAMLKKKLSPPAALRQAQREMAELTRWHSPYYWAAFTMQGDWQ